MKNLSKIIGSAIVLLLVVAFGYSLHTGVTKTLGDQVQNDVFYFTNGAAFGSNGRTLLNYAHLDIGKGQNQVSWLNNTGKPVKIPIAETFVTTSPGSSATAIASSTLALYAGTSTTATIANSANPIYGSIIDGTLIATSTPQNSFNGIVNSAFSGTREQGVVRVPNGQYVIFTVENPYNQACTGVTCESATSSNRGMNFGVDFPIITSSTQ